MDAGVPRPPPMGQTVASRSRRSSGAVGDGRVAEAEALRGHGNGFRVAQLNPRCAALGSLVGKREWLPGPRPFCG